MIQSPGESVLVCRFVRQVESIKSVISFLLSNSDSLVLVIQSQHCVMGFGVELELEGIVHTYAICQLRYGKHKPTSNLGINDVTTLKLVKCCLG